MVGRSSLFFHSSAKHNFNDIAKSITILSRYHLSHSECPSSVAQKGLQYFYHRLDRPCHNRFLSHVINTKQTLHIEINQQKSWNLWIIAIVLLASSGPALDWANRILQPSISQSRHKTTLWVDTCKLSCPMLCNRIAKKPQIYCLLGRKISSWHDLESWERGIGIKFGALKYLHMKLDNSETCRFVIESA